MLRCSMQKDDAIRARHILDAAQEAVEFTKGRARQDLDTDSMLSLALVRLLEIIGEATKVLSPEFCAAHSSLPWKKMAGMRDRLIHGYFDINHDIVWETVTKDLPPLIATLTQLAARKDE